MLRRGCGAGDRAGACTSGFSSRGGSIEHAPGPERDAEWLVADAGKDTLGPGLAGFRRGCRGGRRCRNFHLRMNPAGTEDEAGGCSPICPIEPGGRPIRPWASGSRRRECKNVAEVTAIGVFTGYSIEDSIRTENNVLGKIAVGFAGKVVMDTVRPGPALGDWGRKREDLSIVMCTATRDAVEHARPVRRRLGLLRVPFFAREVVRIVSVQGSSLLRWGQRVDRARVRSPATIEPSIECSSQADQATGKWEAPSEE